MKQDKTNNNTMQRMAISANKTLPEKYVRELETKKNDLKVKEGELTRKAQTFGCATLTEFDAKEINTETPSAESQIALKIEVSELLKEKKQVDDLSNAIFIEQSLIHESIDAAEELLINNRCDIYQRSGRLVRLVKISSLPTPKKGNIRRPSEAVIIKEIDHIFLNEQLTKIGIWARFNVREKEFQRIACPEKISRHLLARQEWKVPVLTGVVNAPTLRSDGSILKRTGYDDQTGIFFINDGATFAEIPENPTKEEAEDALNILLDLIKDFPFDGDTSKSVAVSAILTGLVRKSITNAPLHCFTAPQMASGKSLLADVVSLVAIGKSNSVISHADNETEEKKRLLAVLIEGDPIVCYDNIEEPFGSEALCSILTQDSFKGRLLGKNENATAPTTVFFLATGNNLVLMGDLSTRALMCKIDPEVERPEERSFDRDLRKFIPENRHKLVPAALTILRAYIVAGKPKQNIKPYGRFEGYSDLVRSAIVWIGMADPCESRKEIENADPVRLLLGGLLLAWHDAFGEEAKMVKDVITDIQGTTGTKKRTAIEKTIYDIALDHTGNINERKLGKFLGSHCGRIDSGLRFEKAGTSNRAILWRVKKIEDKK